MRLEAPLPAKPSYQPQVFSNTDFKKKKKIQKEQRNGSMVQNVYFFYREPRFDSHRKNIAICRYQVCKVNIYICIGKTFTLYKIFK